MIQSMTGFGKSTLLLTQKKITIEIKFLYIKKFDLKTLIPQAYRDKELQIRKQIADTLERGKIDLTLTIENTSDKNSTIINADIVKGYINQMLQIIPNADTTELLKMAVRMPDALVIPTEEIQEEEYKQIENIIQQALAELKQFRIQEGKNLQKDFELRIENIKKLLVEIEKLDPERLLSVRERLEKSVAEIAERVDENRFEQELIFYFEKLDITEEKVRLSNHLNYFLQTLNEPQSNGRKLGFIAQEMGREINTLGSKASHAAKEQFVVLINNVVE